MAIALAIPCLPTLDPPDPPDFFDPSMESPAMGIHARPAEAVAWDEWHLLQTDLLATTAPVDARTCTVKVTCKGQGGEVTFACIHHTLTNSPSVCMDKRKS